MQSSLPLTMRSVVHRLMNDYPLSNKNFLIDYLKQHDIRLRKRFGQNFAIDRNLFETILSAAEISPDDSIIEIGPGIGSLTEWLVATDASVIAVEIDTSLYPLLMHHFADRSNFTLVQGDILDRKILDEIMSRVKNRTGNLKVVANLPYYITSPILINLLQGPVIYDRIVVTIQKEVAERIVAQTGTKQYSALTIFMQHYARCILCDTFAPSSFFPSPRVSSSVLLIEPYAAPPLKSINAEFFHSFVKLCFTERRKMIKNSISALCGNLKLNFDKQTLESLLTAHNIAPDLRPERLTGEMFINLTNSLWAMLPQTIQRSFLPGAKGE